MTNKTLKIDHRLIGDQQPVYMIAEIGLNHNGNVEIAKKLIDAAFACNWHCVKFQKRTPEICVPEPQKNVLRDTPWGRMTYLEYRYRVEFEKKEYDYIDKYEPVSEEDVYEPVGVPDEYEPVVDDNEYEPVGEDDA